MSHDDVRREGMRQYGFGPEAMKNRKVCRKCGAASPASSLYCSSCGARLPHETLFEQYKKRHRCCPYCEAILDDDAEYCFQCGQKLPALQKEK